MKTLGLQVRDWLINILLINAFVSLLPISCFAKSEDIEFYDQRGNYHFGDKSGDVFIDYSLIGHKDSQDAGNGNGGHLGSSKSDKLFRECLEKEFERGVQELNKPYMQY